jgi:hypothetical protein
MPELCTLCESHLETLGSDARIRTQLNSRHSTNTSAKECQNMKRAPASLWGDCIALILALALAKMTSKGAV